MGGPHWDPHPTTRLGTNTRAYQRLHTEQRDPSRSTVDEGTEARVSKGEVVIEETGLAES